MIEGSRPKRFKKVGAREVGAEDVADHDWTFDSKSGSISNPKPAEVEMYLDEFVNPNHAAIIAANHNVREQVDSFDKPV